MTRTPVMGPLIPPGAESRCIDTSLGRVHLLHAGTPHAERVPLVLVHGGGGDAASVSWYRLIEPLSRGREVWAIDLPGFGGSMDLDGVGSAARMAGIVSEVIDRAVGAPVAAIGVSMGGDVVLNLGLDHPECVRGIVAIAPGGLLSRFRSPVVHALTWWATRWPDWLMLPLSRVANRFVRSSLRAMVRDPEVIPPEVVEEFVRLSRHPRGAIGYLRYNQASIGRGRMLNDLTGRIGELRMPALFFHGMEDPLVNPQDSVRAAAAIPGAKLVLQPDCGHWAQLEAHDAFLAALLPFLDEIDGQDRGGP
ncbi:alpha/beta fold hydrolase [Leucobacter tenebrionis]|uniref:alpha/beta fold hydrolase n=1 Tax=Leucobacter tenebrionis TaxID=2873270 RepID=UPI001CA6531A|nr:alpha/beta hydrolase [Leucobacter tenebrionis]QZY51525.1 alpha/beta hydrolase [Leucobacter tenebrionis]